MSSKNRSNVYIAQYDSTRKKILAGTWNSTIQKQNQHVFSAFVARRFTKPKEIMMCTIKNMFASTWCTWNQKRWPYGVNFQWLLYWFCVKFYLKCNWLQFAKRYEKWHTRRHHSNGNRKKTPTDLAKSIKRLRIMFIVVRSTKNHSQFHNWNSRTMNWYLADVAGCKWNFSNVHNFTYDILEVFRAMENKRGRESGRPKHLQWKQNILDLLIDM